ncbi:hypothetical protein D9613_004429 [Agrocybe pediades]|uniref:Uncharacterized protein n=1 Tax=Agrocybe pediades TaxID=84607 RepID=A0A8H4VJC1_9AGAR|nr:hypothetical protein D9613_004429 [Agrocybe pediades]
MINDLINKSSGQFIYASTIVRYVQSPRHRPHQRLEAIFHLRPAFKDLPFTELDALYRHIISKAENLPTLLDVLAFPALYGCCTVIGIETLLQLEPNDVEIMLVDVQSIVTVHNDMTISFLHKSLTDFLSEPQRAGNLYQDLSALRLQHVARSVSIFSKAQIGQVTEISDTMYLPLASVVDQLHGLDNAKDEYVSSDILQAVQEFPISEISKSLLVHGRGEWQLYSNCELLTHYVQYLHFVKDVSESARLIYLAQIRRYCECTLSVLEDDLSDDWKANFIFMYYHLLPNLDLDRRQRNGSLSSFRNLFDFMDVGTFGSTIVFMAMNGRWHNSEKPFSPYLPVSVSPSYAMNGAQINVHMHAEHLGLRGSVNPNGEQRNPGVGVS